MSNKSLWQRRQRNESFRLEPIRTPSSLSMGLNNNNKSNNSNNKSMSCKKNSSNNDNYEHVISDSASQVDLSDNEVSRTKKLNKNTSFRHRRTLSALQPLSASSASTCLKSEESSHSEKKRKNKKRCDTDLQARMQAEPVYWQAHEQNALFAGPLGEVIGYVNKGHIIREVTRYCDPFGGWWLCVMLYQDLQFSCTDFTNRSDERQRINNNNSISGSTPNNINHEEYKVAWVSFNNSQWHSCATQHTPEPLWSCVRECADTSADVEVQKCKLTFPIANNKARFNNKLLSTNNVTTNCNAPPLGVWEETKCPLHVAPLADMHDMYNWYDQLNTKEIQNIITVDNSAGNNINKNNNNSIVYEECENDNDTYSKLNTFVEKTRDAELIDYYWSKLSTHSCTWNAHFQSLLENVIYADDKVEDKVHDAGQDTDEFHGETQLRHFINEFVEFVEDKVVQLVSQLALPSTLRTFVPHSSLTNVYFSDDLIFIMCAEMSREVCTGYEISAKIATHTFYNYQELSVHAASHFCHIPLQCLVEFCGHTVRVMAIPPTNLQHVVYKQSSRNRDYVHFAASTLENYTLPYSPQLVKRLMEEITNSTFCLNYESKETVTQLDASKSWLTFDAECYAGWDHRLYLLDVDHCLPTLMTLPSTNQLHDNSSICKHESKSKLIKREINALIDKCSSSNGSNCDAGKTYITCNNYINTKSIYINCIMRLELLHKLTPLQYKITKELVTTSQVNKSGEKGIEDTKTNSHKITSIGECKKFHKCKEVALTENGECINNNVDMCGEREWKLDVCDEIKHNVITTVAGTLGLHLPVIELDMPCVECTLCNHEISNEMRFVVCDSAARCCHICQHCYLRRLVAIREMSPDASVEESRANKYNLKPVETSMDEHNANDGKKIITESNEVQSEQTLEYFCSSSGNNNIAEKIKILNAFVDAVKCNGNARHWNALLLEPDVATLFHSHGLNLRFLPFVYHRLPQPTKFAMGHYCKVEILARCAAHLLRRKLRITATTPAEVQQCATEFFTTFLETYSERAAEFFANELAAEIHDSYGDAVLPFATSTVSKLLLAEALQAHTGVHLTEHSLNSLRKSDFVNSELINFSRCNYTNTSSLCEQKECHSINGNPFVEVQCIYPIVKTPAYTYAKYIPTYDLPLSPSKPSETCTQSLQEHSEKPEPNIEQSGINEELTQHIANDYDVNEDADNKIDSKTLSELLLFWIAHDARMSEEGHTIQMECEQPFYLTDVNEE